MKKLLPLLPVLRDAAATYAIGKVAKDEVKIPHDFYHNKIEPIQDHLITWSRKLDGVELNKPGTWLSAGSTIIQNAVTEAPIQVDPVSEFINSEELVTITDSILWLFLPRLRSTTPRLFEQNNKNHLFMIETEEVTVYIKADSEELDLHNDNKISSYKFYIKEEKMDGAIQWASAGFWDKYSAVAISRGQNGFDASRVEYSPKRYRGSMVNLIDELRNFTSHNVRRVCLLQGEPGTGKSTLCSNIAEDVNDRVMVVTNDFIQSIEKDEWFSLISALKPKVVLIDDIDRISDKILEQCLSMFEETNYRVPITLLTTNDHNRLPPALRRPGRIDDLRRMPSPTKDIQLEMLQEFIQNINDDTDFDVDLSILPPYAIKVLSDQLANNVSGAFIKEIAIRFVVNGGEYQIPENDIQFEKMRPVMEQHRKEYEADPKTYMEKHNLA